ncbi:hypothetical protein HPB50_015969 [Hyalomma asiaticum]|uniref:Uncharacterized protein n=1 Tax=Hyalomma asiaticum TaxID=266040 RepID=A0ACB7T340_HYAAI|nr:hypothetical protein HPB50_015969 [Hyalomma asiaticum]
MTHGGAANRYPGKLYEEAARELVTKFPSLADSTGTGYDSWRTQLRYKAKYQRRKLKVQDEADSPLPHKRAKKAEESTQKRVSRPSLVHQEFKALTEVTLLLALKNALQPFHHKIMASAKSKHHLEDFFKVLADVEGATPEPAKDDLMLTAAMYVLPSLVKERMEAFVRIREPEAVYLVPTVTYTGQILTTVEFIVHLEMLPLPAASLLEAIATQMALYWTFDIVFYAKTQKTFDLICRLLGVGSGVQATPLVRVAHTLLQK